jgi:phosphate transport system permease protein
MADKFLKFFSFSVFAIILICPLIFLYYSLPLIKSVSLSDILFSSWDPDSNRFGLSEFIAVSFFIAVLSTMLSFLLSFGVAIKIYFSKNKILKNIITFMTGIPTVVYGFFGIVILVPVIREHTPSPSGLSILTVVIVLSVLILPTIVLYIVETFNSLPKDIRETALSLGATEEQFIVKVLLPFSMKGIVTGFILGFGRAVSDTMIALMLSGNSFGFPYSVFAPGRALTSHIALLMPGEFDSIEFKSIFFSAFVFILLILSLNILLRKLDK